MKKDAQLTIRLSTATKDALKTAAQALRRTPNWLVVTILEKWLDTRQRRRQRK